MTDLEKAAWQALEALIRADRISGYPNNKEAITALRRALEQPAQQEPVGEVSGYYDQGFTEHKTLYGKLHNQDLPIGTKLYTRPAREPEQPAQQEPVAVVTGTYGGRFTVEPLKPAAVLPVNMALYTRFQAREPVLQEIARLHDRIKELENDVEFLSRPTSAIKQSLTTEQPAIPPSITCPFCESEHVPGWLHDLNMDRSGHPEPEQPAQQEPVAWIVEDKYGERLEWAADADIGWGNKTEPLYTRPQAREPLTDERIESVRHMRDVQGYDGNWNYDPYMQGLYNGLEFALSLLEGRQPEFKDAPETWLGDIKVKYKLSSEATHGIKGDA